MSGLKGLGLCKGRYGRLGVEAGRLSCRVEILPILLIFFCASDEVQIGVLVRGNHTLHT